MIMIFRKEIKNMKIAKKLFSLLLCFSMILSSSNLVFASQPNNYEVEIGEDGITKTLNVSVINGISTVFDGENTIVFDCNTGKLIITNQNGNVETSQINLRNSRAANNYKNEYSYNYKNKTSNKKTGTFWEIKIPNKIKNTYQTNANSTNLNRFASSVDSIVSNANLLNSKGFESVISIVLGVLAGLASVVSAAVIVGVLSGLGFGTPADVVSAFKSINASQKDAEKYFNATTVISSL